jgi:hypothetical protein
MMEPIPCAVRIARFAGGEAEFDMFHDRRGDPGDLHAIDMMMERLELAWTERKLLGMRHAARRGGRAKPA